jgi:hypothetical protein
MDRGLCYLEINVLESTSYMLLFASKTSFTEWYAKLLRAPTLIYLPYCANLNNKSLFWSCISKTFSSSKTRTSHMEKDLKKKIAVKEEFEIRIL